MKKRGEGGVEAAARSGLRCMCLCRRWYDACSHGTSRTDQLSTSCLLTRGSCRLRRPPPPQTASTLHSLRHPLRRQRSSNLLLRRPSFGRSYPSKRRPSPAVVASSRASWRRPRRRRRPGRLETGTQARRSASDVRCLPVRHRRRVRRRLSSSGVTINLHSSSYTTGSGPPITRLRSFPRAKRFRATMHKGTFPREAIRVHRRAETIEGALSDPVRPTISQFRI